MSRARRARKDMRYYVATPPPPGPAITATRIRHYLRRLYYHTPLLTLVTTHECRHLRRRNDAEAAAGPRYLFFTADISLSPRYHAAYHTAY